EARAANVMIDNVGQLREDLRQSRAIAREFDVAVQSVKEPERCISSMIKPLIFSFGKHVWDESVAYVMSEGSENPARLGEAACRKSQPFEADHGIAPPICEPMVAGDDCAHFVPRGARAGGVSDAPGWSNDELIGGEN